ncbi:MAG: acetyl-CoA carboxylase biotin carboxylase subunit [Halioglobus sp.]
MTRFNSILIANRGEIACRIIRTAKALGYRTVAVYSEADTAAPHVQMADEAVCIGPGPVNESYLVAENILQAAAVSGAQAVHPGYGFMSENASFAQACEDAGLVFIGPTAESIHLMGNKAEAKRRMIDAGVPCVPGYEGEDQSDATLVAQAQNIALPLMVKAAAGGGGRGMRLVHDEKDLADAIKLARAEAESSFGSGELILEKAIVRPRHVEVQVFADTQGNTVHMGERDCSVQRRHQKVIEEAPCPIMTDELRARMGEAAVQAAKNIQYRGAGTVEFLLDESGEFYFLEMNTRLQVEHPVTEIITGLDLVELQIQVAQGEQLGLSQEDISLSGHAIEVRLYTEDPAQDFLPMSGPVDLWEPASGVGVRIDGGICTGQDISPFYDPMVAKVIAGGPTREIARLRLLEALRETLLFGTKNNKDFLIACLDKQVFIDGLATTAFIQEEFVEGEISDSIPSFSDSAVAAVLEINMEYLKSKERSVIVASNLKNWSSASALLTPKRYNFDEVSYSLSITPMGGEQYRVIGNDESVVVEIVSLEGNTAHVAIDGSQQIARFHTTETGLLYLSIEGRTACFRDLVRLEGSADTAGGDGSVTAPMHGILLEVLVSPGDTVAAGQTLAVLEAMKMHYQVTAEIDGKILEVTAQAGKQVAADDLLIQIEVDAGNE